MIKYAELEGYQNLGELGMFSHLYRFYEKESDDPVMIFIHAYDVAPAQVFKGKVHAYERSYKNINLTDKEKEMLAKFAGDYEQVDFSKFASNHESLLFARDFKEARHD